MLLLPAPKRVSSASKMGQDRHQDTMTKEGLEKQKTIEMCNEMLEHLKHDDVVYSIRETGTGTNIHIELDHSTGEYPTFTIFKTYPTRRLTGNNHLKPPLIAEEKKPSLRRSIGNSYGKIIKSCSMETLENKPRKDLDHLNVNNDLTKSTSMETMHSGCKKIQLKKTFSSETIDCGQLESLRHGETIRNKVSRASSMTQGQKLQKRNSFVGSKESVASLDNIEEHDETRKAFENHQEKNKTDKVDWYKGCEMTQHNLNTSDSRFSSNVQNGTKKLCRLLKRMKSTKLKNIKNEEVSALDSALDEDIDTLTPAMIIMEEELDIELEKEEQKRKKVAEERKRLEREWRKRAAELYITRKKSKKTLDEMVTNLFLKTA